MYCSYLVRYNCFAGIQHFKLKAGVDGEGQRGEEYKLLYGQVGMFWYG